MPITAAEKKELFRKHSPTKSEKDTGSPESQIALFTRRINEMTEHLNVHKKDFATQRGLLKLVGKRKKMLNYLQQENIERYRAILAELNLRK
ncbi:MAG: 30S ribosomal protein S15 [Cyclobacteriaceae bacterium]|nr:30S ribosomal protein S15 [Cyclobacteriaceae bacterium]MCX7636696.1 30S ribosomal protein S15 [Cyclobacteriaceae bacterium]MDW8332260.1 30S ribosomal protein S15 [Cyclobacteriaceae bacterium]